jgi:hypothetical protein
VESVQARAAVARRQLARSTELFAFFEDNMSTKLEDNTSTKREGMIIFPVIIPSSYWPSLDVGS